MEEKERGKGAERGGVGMIKKKKRKNIRKRGKEKEKKTEEK